MQMRLNKVSELIHNSTYHQNLDSAGVSVYFQEIIDLVIIFYLTTFWISSYVLFHNKRWFMNSSESYFWQNPNLLQDDGTYEALPGSDFVITRVAFRDNSSKYYINDRASNFTEVTKKLKGKGVDLDNNRFLILQVWGLLSMVVVWV